MEGQYGLPADLERWHHAYILVGNREWARTEIRRILEALVGQALETTPDWREIVSLSFGIDESRLLREQQGRKPLVLPRQFFLLSFDTITEEAQNALLKTLEEPSPSTHLFVAVSKSEILLPTVRSRCQIINIGESSIRDPQVVAWAEAFLKALPPERISMIERVTKKAEEEDGAVIKSFCLGVLNGLEEWVVQPKPHGSRYVELMTTIGQTRSYLYDRAASPRLLLERLAFLIPTL